jgi:hypothetical protein
MLSYLLLVFKIIIQLFPFLQVVEGGLGAIQQLGNGAFADVVGKVTFS